MHRSSQALTATVTLSCAGAAAFNSVVGTSFANRLASGTATVNARLQARRGR